SRTEYNRRGREGSWREQVRGSDGSTARMDRAERRVCGRAVRGGRDRSRVAALRRRGVRLVYARIDALAALRPRAPRAGARDRRVRLRRARAHGALPRPLVLDRLRLRRRVRIARAAAPRRRPPLLIAGLLNSSTACKAPLARRRRRSRRAGVMLSGVRSQFGALRFDIPIEMDRSEASAEASARRTTPIGEGVERHRTGKVTNHEANSAWDVSRGRILRAARGLRGARHAREQRLRRLQDDGEEPAAAVLAVRL